MSRAKTLLSKLTEQPKLPKKTYTRSIKVLNHITFLENLQTIKKEGLVPRKRYSKYGNPPILKAVYLYHSNNAALPNEFKKMYQGSNLIIVKVDGAKLDKGKFSADEDFYRYPRKRKVPSLDRMKQDAFDCLETRGSIAYLDTIPASKIKEIEENF